MGFWRAQWFQARLFWSLFKDPQVGCLFKGGYILVSIIAVLVYWIAPDLIPGPVDDLLVSSWAIPFLLTYPFVGLLPSWLVELHRVNLLVQSESQPPPTEQSAEEEPASEEPDPQPQTQPETEVDRSRTVAIHRSGGWSVFHFTGTIAELIESNPALKKALSKLGELKDLNLKVRKRKELKVVGELSRRLDGLRVIYANSKDGEEQDE